MSSKTNLTSNISVKRIYALVITFALAAILASCGTLVERKQATDVTDLSGEWNDTDSRLVAEEMIKDLLSRNWLSRFKSQNQHPPAVVIGKISNLSHEHINTMTFIKEIQKSIINSGQVNFVASSKQRGQLRDEKVEQDKYSSSETRKSANQEIGADFMLQGTINTIVDVGSSSKKVKFYQVNLSLINILNNRIAWVGEKKIKKLVNKSSFRF